MSTMTRKQLIDLLGDTVEPSSKLFDDAVALVEKHIPKTYYYSMSDGDFDFNFSHGTVEALDEHHARNQALAIIKKAISRMPIEFIGHTQFDNLIVVEQ